MIAFTLKIPAPKIRKIQAPIVKAFKDKAKYCRKVKHKGKTSEES